MSATINRDLAKLDAEIAFWKRQLGGANKCPSPGLRKSFQQSIMKDLNKARANRRRLLKELAS